MNFRHLQEKHQLHLFSLFELANLIPAHASLAYEQNLVNARCTAYEELC